MSFASKHNDYLDPDIHNKPWMDDEEDESHLTPAQKGQITRLASEIYNLKHKLYEDKNRIKFTQESLFKDLPEGDFHCDGEPEDVGNAWNCGDSDCESGWHESVQYIDMGRKGYKTWFVVYEDSISGCGDYQPCAGWDEREGDEVNQQVLDDLWFHLEARSIEHFAGWAMYCLDCARTGKDPLDNWRYGKPCTPDEAIKAARDNVKFLRRTWKRVASKQ